MKKYYVLYNPLSDNGRGREHCDVLEFVYDKSQMVYVDLTALHNYGEFFASVLSTDEVILCGGDGTLNRFINATQKVDIPCKIRYFACGSGNDFMRDVVTDDKTTVDLTKYIQNLPTVSVNGIKRKFINGVGYGIDGYCCKVAEQMRNSGKKEKINYSAIAVKGLLMDYKPTDATVTVDGKQYRYEKVWIAPTMNGRYYGGGMMAAPAQDRCGDELSVMVFHGGKLGVLSTFPSIFTGRHINHKSSVTVLTGKNITVRFDSPRELQIDGELIPSAYEYTATKP